MCWPRWWSMRSDHRGRRGAPAWHRRLGDTGQQIEVSLRLPVLAGDGNHRAGAFVEYQDGSVTRLGSCA